MVEIAANLAMTRIIRASPELLFVEKRRNMRRFSPLSDAGGLALCSIWEVRSRCGSPSHGAPGLIQLAVA
jgi:hypothetical protein